MIRYAIYVIDDEQTIREGIQMSLEEDYKVSVFSEAETAIDAIGDIGVITDDRHVPRIIDRIVVPHFNGTGRIADVDNPEAVFQVGQVGVAAGHIHALGLDHYNHRHDSIDSLMASGRQGYRIHPFEIARARYVASRMDKAIRVAEPPARAPQISP